jgi:hypothetical protein
MVAARTRAPILQRDIERAIRAARNAGLVPTSTECHPDGKIVLCFDERKLDPNNALDSELETWRQASATA